MAGSRRLIELSIKRTELRELESIARSRTEAAGRVERARVSVRVEATFRFSEVAAAYERFAAGGKLGKIVLVP